MPTRDDLRYVVDPSLRDAIASADWIVANCEAPLAETSRVRGIRFQLSATTFARMLEAFGPPPERWVLSLANNHAEDQGARALAGTARRLERLGARVIGLRAGEENDDLVTAVGSDPRVGIVAWTAWRNRPSNAEYPRPWTAADLDGADWPALRRDLRIDRLVGFPHWDREFCHVPSPATRRAAGELARRGFGVLCGHHPHVVQGVEEIGRTLVLYSAGNAVSNDGCAWRRACRLGLVWLVDLGVDPERELAYQVIPFVFERREREARLRRLDAADVRERALFDAVFPTRGGVAPALVTPAGL